MDIEEFLILFNKECESDIELQDSFKSYCGNRLIEIGKNTNYNQELTEKYFKEWFDWIMTFSLDRKRRMFIKDKAYEQLFDISEDVFNNSYKKATNKDFKQYDEETIVKLNELYEKVRFFNKENAKRFLDDALKELDYMDNPNDSKMSLRLFKITHPDIIID